MNHPKLALFLLFLVACGDSSSGGPPGAATTTTPTTPTASIDGKWDVSALGDVLESGSTGTLLITDGKVDLELPLARRLIPSTCSRSIGRVRFSMAFSKNVASGDGAIDEQFNGTDCGPGRPSGLLVSKPFVVSAKRISEKPGSLTDLNGEWGLTVSDSSKVIVLSIDGGSFSGVHKNKPSERILTGSIANGRVSVTGQGIEFAAQHQ